MEIALASVLAAFVAIAHENCERREQVSMLQPKDRPLNEPTGLMKAANAAALSFKTDAQMENAIDGAKTIATAMSEAEGKEILLQRTSRSDHMADLIGKLKHCQLRTKRS